MDELWKKSDNFFFDSWRENREYGELLLYGAGNNPDQLLFWARIPTVLLTLALGIAIYLIARRHWGALAGFVATGLYCFNPTKNGHGHLITTDIALALGYLLTVYFFWQFLVSPSKKTAMLFGFGLGLAIMSKHTAIILVPALIVIALFAWFSQESRPRFWPTVGKLALSLLIAWAMLWAGYGFRDAGLPATSSATFASREANANNGEISSSHSDEKIDRGYSHIRPLTLLFPNQYLKGLFLVLAHASNGHQAFLLGQTSTSGWWYYFPVLFLLKTPLPALALFFGALYVLIRQRGTAPLAVVLALSGGVFFLFAMNSKANLGVRHIMPVFAPLMLIAGWAVSQNKKLAAGAILLLVWSAVVMALAMPNYLSYYNELVGGSRQGYRIATDSNADWGQDLIRIAQYAKKNNISPLFLEYGWNGLLANNYYIGEGNYLSLSERRPGDRGFVIVGASAVNEKRYSYLRDCPKQGAITASVFICELEASDE